MGFKEFVAENLKEDIGMVSSDSAADVLNNLEAVTATVASIFLDLQKDSRMYKAKEVEAKVRELRDGLKKLKAPSSNDVFTREEKLVLERISKGIIDVTTQKITEMSKNIAKREKQVTAEPEVEVPVKLDIEPEKV